MTEDRLSRMEGKIDKLAEAVVSLARMEERMVTLFKRMDKYDQSQIDLDERVSNMEKSTIKRSVWETTLGKAFWVIFGAGVVFIINSKSWGM